MLMTDTVDRVRVVYRAICAVCGGEMADLRVTCDDDTGHAGYVSICCAGCGRARDFRVVDPDTSWRSVQKGEGDDQDGRAKQVI